MNNQPPQKHRKIQPQPPLIKQSNPPPHHLSNNQERESGLERESQRLREKQPTTIG